MRGARGIMTDSHSTTYSFAKETGWLAAEADVLLYFVTGTEETLSDLPPDLVGEITRRRQAGHFTCAAGEVTALPTYGLLPAPYVIAAGLGPAPAGRDALRAAAVHAAREAQRLGLSRLAVRLPGGDYAAAPVQGGGMFTAPACDASASASQAGTGSAAGALPQNAAAPCTADLAATVFTVTEGLLLGAYRMATYARGAQPRPRLAAVQYFVHPDGLNEEVLQAAVSAAETYADATNYARDLTNMPGNLLTPSALAEEAERLAGQYGFACEVLGEEEIVARGMGALAAVGLGSANPPRMITLRYDGDPSSQEVLGLVGKGVTFDTGGISIKPAGGMEEMISDMGGAAVLLGVLMAAGRLKPKVNLLVVIPAAENMPSGTAMRPGDVVTTLSGRTIEVLNTDAEGRMILADGVTYARQLGATRLIDVATLTGAVLVSFADLATGALTNDDAFYGEFLQASVRAGERVWQLPNYPEYQEMLRSDVADIKNAAAHKFAGAIMGGCFVQAFVEGLPWIHLDTGGTAWLWGERGIEPKGGTGAMVRTIIDYVCSALPDR
ncbi:leucyl aminopeptidase [Paenibacillus sp. FJAT-26967]|uniref:leucyl aminopeptidase n=1 Tax=Paenibacillus sp. FJAT-26967 TaxID=1729690 RepID=UPI0020A2B1C3|nr:leucyl aminopeptidase [Paenibacillus sp. FJAT-26967]